jgi:predicted RNase H-like nuclease
VRPLLGGRQSSVFSVPSRAAVYAAEYREACAVAVTTSDPPKKVSKQCFHLFPKIREVDGLLREQPALTPRVFEVHPEVAFWRLNGERSLTEPKKVKGRPWPAGLAERRGILIRAGLPNVIVEARPPAGAASDDLLDALANLMVAERILRGEARPFPDPPGRDSFGLPVAIWA